MSTICPEEHHFLAQASLEFAAREQDKKLKKKSKSKKKPKIKGRTACRFYK